MTLAASAGVEAQIIPMHVDFFIYIPARADQSAGGRADPITGGPGRPPAKHRPAVAQPRPVPLRAWLGEEVAAARLEPGRRVRAAVALLVRYWCVVTPILFCGNSI